MSQSSDYEDLDNAIDELRGVSSILDIDLDDSISELEATGPPPAPGQDPACRGHRLHHPPVLATPGRTAPVTACTSISGPVS